MTRTDCATSASRSCAAYDAPAPPCAARASSRSIVRSDVPRCGAGPPAPRGYLVAVAVAVALVAVALVAVAVAVAVAVVVVAPRPPLVLGSRFGGDGDGDARGCG